MQGGYDLVVAIKPDDENTVFVGGTNLYRSTTGFTTAGATTRIGGYNSPASYALYPNHHPDIHALTFAPNNPDIMASGTDGGIHSADITAATVGWTSLNNDYVTYQYYHVAIDPTAGSDYAIGGAQDNGTTQTLAGTTHSAVGSGDGVSVGISSGGLLYFGSQLGQIRRNGTSIKPTGSGSGLFVTKFHLDPDNTELLYYADSDRIYRTVSASTVTAGTWTLMTGIEITLTSSIYAFATTRGGGYAASDATRKLYLGTGNGQVYRLNDPAFVAAATVPVNITPAAAGAGVVSHIAVNPNNDSEVLVTYANYGIPSVFHTTNADAATPTWTQVEGNLNLPSYRSCAIVQEGGNTYYLVGTTVDMYCTTALAGAGTVWSRIGANSIGFAVVSDMDLRPGDNILLAGTHGNGMFVVEPPRTPEISFTAAASSQTETTATTVACRGYRDINIPMIIGGVPTGDAIMTIFAAGRATPGSDYDILNPASQLTFPSGSSLQQQVQVRIYDDNEEEADETVTLTYSISGATDAVPALANQVHTLTITDNDPAVGLSASTLWSEDWEGAAAGWLTTAFVAPVNRWIIKCYRTDRL
ncbi:MAG: hypothetical protein OHK0039_28180 [Bacteroidia bacterium]